MPTKLVRIELESGKSMWINPKAIKCIGERSPGYLTIRVSDGYFVAQADHLDDFCEYLRTDRGIVISND